MSSWADGRLCFCGRPPYDDCICRWYDVYRSISSNGHILDTYIPPRLTEHKRQHSLVKDFAKCRPKVPHQSIPNNDEVSHLTASYENGLMYVLRRVPFLGAAQVSDGTSTGITSDPRQKQRCRQNERGNGEEAIQETTKLVRSERNSN